MEKGFPFRPVADDEDGKRALSEALFYLTGEDIPALAPRVVKPEAKPESLKQAAKPEGPKEAPRGQPPHAGWKTFLPVVIPSVISSSSCRPGPIGSPGNSRNRVIFKISFGEQTYENW